MDKLIDDELLDQRLREAAPYIDDGGFTAAVLQRLPAASPVRRSVRSLILIGVTIIACALAYFLSDGGRFIHGVVEQLAGLPMLWLLSLTFCTGLLASAGGLVAAMTKLRDISS